MFSSYHCIWMAVCAVLVVGAVIWLKRCRPGLRKVLSVACACCILSELTKTLSVLKLVPSADGSALFPYLELRHLPLHLCSIQILFVFYTCFARDSKRRDMILAFMYPTCVIGAILAILMPNIFGESIEACQAFVHPLGYQYFLYHAMLIVLGLYIPLCGEVNIRPRHYLTTLGLLTGLAFTSLYLNSMFAVSVYENGVLQSVDFTTNFFFTYQPPLGIQLTELWHWYLYLGVILTIAVVVIGLFYLPWIRAGRRSNPPVAAKE